VGNVCADRVIGKAAAMLLIYGGITELFAEVISEHALEFLNTCDITVEYRKKTKHIINRKGDGMCPMEEKALLLNSPTDAFTLFSNIVK